MSNKCIGIISYLPDNKSRNNRLNRLKTLINTCNNLFNLPIYIVIQNYHEDEINLVTKYRNVSTSQNYNKCGIVGARRKLREWFINSQYECLIMLDDDSIICGNRDDACKYLKQLDDNPNMFYEFTSSLLKLFAISKNIFKEVDFEDINPENGDGFEDRVFVGRLRKLFPNNRYIIEKGNLYECSLSTKDPDSTWYDNQDIKQMLLNTNKYLEN